MAMADPSRAQMTDGLGRRISYLRISVTDRCDLRCRYCMAEKMQFLPKNQVLTLEEIAVLADLFVARGINKIRLTGGEPLVRRDIGDLVRRIGRHLGNGLDELTLTTNGTQLADHADMLADAGVRRINVSLDSRDPARFAHVTRGGNIAAVFAGLKAAQSAGLAIKINMVVMEGQNTQDILPMAELTRHLPVELRFIEEMPFNGGDHTSLPHWHHRRILDTLRERFSAMGVRDIRSYSAAPARVGGERLARRVLARVEAERDHEEEEDADEEVEERVLPAVGDAGQPDRAGHARQRRGGQAARQQPVLEARALGGRADQPEEAEVAARQDGLRQRQVEVVAVRQHQVEGAGRGQCHLGLDRLDAQALDVRRRR